MLKVILTLAILADVAAPIALAKAQTMCTTTCSGNGSNSTCTTICY